MDLRLANACHPERGRMPEPRDPASVRATWNRGDLQGPVFLSVFSVAKIMRLLTALALLLTTAALAAQTQPDPALLAEIQKIRAIDNHTHVMKVVAPGQQDTEFD